MIKVFLVEDEIVVREGIKNSIDWESKGFKFMGEAGDGELAYPIIKNTKPDIVITDIKMPFMDGLELSKLIKSEMPHIKIVILSGYDEFEYAKQAITLGVTEYLLKPISGNQLIKAIIPIRDIILKEKKQQEFLEKFHKEMKDNEQIKQYTFFQNMISSKQAYGKLIEEGKELGLELSAGAYCLILLKIFADEKDTDEYSEKKIQIEEEMAKISEDNPKIIFFNRITEGISFLCMGNDDIEVEEIIKYCINKVIGIIENYKDFTYFMGVGSKEYRLRQLYRSFDGASKAFAYRYFLSKNQVVYCEDVKGYQIPKEIDFDLKSIDTTKLKKRIIEDFLRNGMENEIGHFVEEYFKNLGTKSMESLLFRQYIVMDFYFVSAIFMEQLNYSLEKTEEILGGFQKIHTVVSSLEETKHYLKDLITKVLQCRMISSKKKYQIIIANAKDYILKNYSHEEMSLNMVAASVNFSPSHFSTIFSQETGLTFVEYLTKVRMEKAKELLISRDMRITDVGYEVGYRDSHYFSYLFKKTQGISPKDYRTRTSL